MNMLVSLVAVLALALIALVGAWVPGLDILFGILIPYAAVITFIAGIIYKVWQWASAPVPFRIPTTSGQQTSLPWIKANPLDNPHNTLTVIGRMALEVLAFRSLFKNTKAELRDGPRLIYGSDKLLWLVGLAFHWSFLVILLRHLRFFTEPVPSFVIGLQALDGFFQIGVPILLVTDLILVGALTVLFLRRVLDPKLRYLSLPADYFPLFLILGVAITGILMRYTPIKTELVAAKELAVGLLSLRPGIPEGIQPIFYVHLFLVSVLFAYFPFSKLTHMAGVFLSPTRNLANNNRVKRHINPWNHDVNVHTYEEWEDEFRDKMKAAGYPLEKE